MSVSVAWQTNSAVVLRAIREVASAKQSAVLQLVRGGRRGRIEMLRGEITCVRAGRLEDLDAFQHLLLWGDDAAITTRANPSPTIRTMHARIDTLVEAGLRFLDQLDHLAAWLGGPRATFERVPRRLKDKTQLPAEVRRFADGIEPGMTLIDLIEASTFRPIDTIKICYRLRELGLITVAGVAAVAGTQAAHDPDDRTVPQERIEPAAPPPIPIVAKKRVRGDQTDTSRRQKITRPPPLPARAPVKPRRSGNTGRIAKIPRIPERKEQVFDEVEEAFFAGAAELVDEAFVDRFEDLENTARRMKLRKQRSGF